MKEALSYDEFQRILNEKAKGRKYKTKIWSNYPKSVFYYWEDDQELRNEIAIYTAETAWGMYI